MMGERAASSRSSVPRISRRRIRGREFGMRILQLHACSSRWWSCELVLQSLHATNERRKGSMLLFSHGSTSPDVVGGISSARVVAAVLPCAPGPSLCRALCTNIIFLRPQDTKRGQEANARAVRPCKHAEFRRKSPPPSVALNCSMTCSASLTMEETDDATAKAAARTSARIAFAR